MYYLVSDLRICCCFYEDFDFDIVNFQFLVGDVRRCASYGVCSSQLIRIARVCYHVADVNARNNNIVDYLYNVFNSQTSPAGLSVS